MRSILATGFGALLCGMAVTGAGAQTIYPINRAEILAGAKFDLKVEFPGCTGAGGGARHHQRTGRRGGARQGARHSPRRKTAASTRPTGSAMPRSSSPARMSSKQSPGDRKAQRHLGGFRHRRRRRPRTSSCSSATACRSRTAPPPASFPRASSKAATAANSPSTTCRTWRWSRPPAPTALVTDSANSMSAYATGHKSCVNAHGRLLRAQQGHSRASAASRRSRNSSSARAACRSASSPTPRSRTPRRPRWWRTRAGAPTTTTS